MFSSRLVIIFMMLTLQYVWVKCSECNDGQYTYDPFDCNAFLQCEHGSWVRRWCARDLHFNRLITACDFPQNANCIIDSTTPPDDTPTPPPITSTSPPTTSTSPPTTSTSPPTTSTSPPTTSTSPPTTSTSPPTTSTSPPTTSTSPPTTSTSPPTTSTSPPMTTTSPPTTSTSPPGETTAPTPPITSTSPPTTSTSPPGETTAPTPPPGQTTTPFPTTTSTPLPSIPPTAETPFPTEPDDRYRCPEVDGPYAVHLPHPNCTMFYKCVHGIPHEMLCPVDQHWANSLELCEFPEVANCTDGVAPEQPDARPPNYW